jgi:hypothetical protein
MLSSAAIPTLKLEPSTVRLDLMCDKWGVMTTIVSPPPESVRRFMYMADWCVVVVGDLDKPQVNGQSYDLFIY